MADKNDPKIEDVKEEVEENVVSEDTTAKSPTEVVEETSDAPVAEETPVAEDTPAPEVPAEDSSQIEANEVSGDTTAESPSTESADEEATDPEKVEEQIDEVEENKVSGDAEAESSSTEANETGEEEKPAEAETAQEETSAEETVEEPTDEKPEVEVEEKDTSKKDEKPEEPKMKKDPNVPDDAKWFIVHTYAGHENKVARNLKQRVDSMGFENRIFDIIVPTRETIKVSQGRKETVQEKIFPGYVIIRMILDDESWLLVRTTQGVTAFIGAGNKPTPISEQEVEAIQKFMQMDEPLYKATFSVGEAVKIVDGPFADFLGTIDAIDEARGKIKVLVSIFGRETPVELDFLQAQKL